MSSDISVCHQYVSNYAYMSPDNSVCHQYVSNSVYICLLILVYVINMSVTMYTYVS